MNKISGVSIQIMKKQLFRKFTVLQLFLHQKSLKLWLLSPLFAKCLTAREITFVILTMFTPNHSPYVMSDQLFGDEQCKLEIEEYVWEYFYILTNKIVFC